MSGSFAFTLEAAMTWHPRQSPPDEYRQQREDLRRRTDWETWTRPDPNWEKVRRPNPDWESVRRQVVRVLSALPRLSRHR